MGFPFTHNETNYFACILSGIFSFSTNKFSMIWFHELPLSIKNNLPISEFMHILVKMVDVVRIFTATSVAVIFGRRLLTSKNGHICHGFSVKHAEIGKLRVYE